MSDRSRFPWIRFIIAQVVLCVAWWYLALWITIGIWGIEEFSGVKQWSVFAALVLLSIIAGAALVVWWRRRRS
jgi:membrane protein DedA with SNARE-associated domain